jgi:acyl-CoA thioester hydrolase
MANSPIYTKMLTIPQSAIDKNGHVSNVAYVQWMQDIAVEHYSSVGGIEAQGPDATWVVREHKIEYLLPTFAKEEIEIKTWVENIRRVRSLRKYEFVRKSDGKLLARGETDWVFVDAHTGSPRAIPENVASVFTLHKVAKSCTLFGAQDFHRPLHLLHTELLLADLGIVHVNLDFVMAGWPAAAIGQLEIDCRNA